MHRNRWEHRLAHQILEYLDQNLKCVEVEMHLAPISPRNDHPWSIVTFKLKTQIGKFSIFRDPRCTIDYSQDKEIWSQPSALSKTTLHCHW